VASLAETLYIEFRREADPTTTPAYGNLDAEQRRVWDRVAAVAEEQIQPAIVGYRCVCGIDHAFETTATAVDRLTRERDEARAEERLTVDAVIGAPHNQAVIATTEHAIAKWARAWIAKWADTSQDSPGIEDLPGLIADGAWRSGPTLAECREKFGTVALVFGAAPVGVPDAHGDIIEPAAMAKAVEEYRDIETYIDAPRLPRVPIPGDRLQCDGRVLTVATIAITFAEADLLIAPETTPPAPAGPWPSMPPNDVHACKVCGATPDETGERRHGKGCYVLSEDGGGSDWPG
jgi:hypothetical protein